MNLLTDSVMIEIECTLIERHRLQEIHRLGRQGPHGKSFMNQQFEQFDVIGTGRYSVIYEGHDHGPLDRSVAIRELADQWKDNSRRQQAFLAEASFLAKHDYEHLLKVYDVVVDSNLVITELLEGSLDKLIAKNGPMSPARVRSVIQQVLKALNYLHKKNTIYGAVRPSKLLYSERGKVKLGCFEKIEDGVVPRPEVEKYVAPETLSASFGPIGPPLDFYCLGFTALELLLGDKFDPLFPVLSGDEGVSDVGWLRWHSSEDGLPPVSKLVPGVPQDLANALDAMLQKKVTDRPQTAFQVFQLLQDIEPVPVLDGVEQSVIPGIGLGKVGGDPRDELIPVKLSESEDFRPQTAAALKPPAKKVTPAKSPASVESPGTVSADAKQRVSKATSAAARKPKPKKKGIPALLKALLLLLLLGGTGLGAWWTYENDPYGWFAAPVVEPPAEPTAKVEPEPIIKEPIEVESEPVPEPELSLDEIFKRGKDALAGKKFDSAIDDFSTVLDRDHAGYLTAYLLRAQSFLAREADEEDHHHAEEDLTDFLGEADSSATDGEKSKAHLLRGRIYREEEELDPAVNDFRASVSLQLSAEVQKELADLLFQRADAALAEKRFGPAIDDLEDVRTLDSEREGIDVKLAAVRFDRGTLKVGTRDFGTAKEDFDRAIELVDYKPEYFVARAECLGKFGESRKGVEDYSTAIKRSSEPAAEWFVGRAALLRKIDQPQKALEDLNQAIELKPTSPEAYATRGKLYREDLKQLPQAIKDFRDALKNGFSPPFEIELAIGDTLYDVSDALGGRRDFNAAIEQLRLALKQFQGTGSDGSLSKDQQQEVSELTQKTLRRMGDYHLATRDYPQAIELYSKTIEQSGDTDYDAFVRRGNCYKAKQQFTEAERDYRRALELDSSSAAARFHLGQMYTKRGDSRRQRRLGAPAGEKEGLKQLAIADYKAAINELTQLIEANPQTRFFDMIISACSQLNTIDSSKANADQVQLWRKNKLEHLATKK